MAAFNVYILNVVLAVFGYFYVSCFGLNRETKSRVYLLGIFILLFVFLAFFDYQTFPDVDYYNMTYQYMVEGSVSDYRLYSSDHLELGFLIFCDIISCLSSDPRWLYIVRSLLFSACIIYTIKKHSVSSFISVLFFFLLFGVNQSIYVVRQYLSIGIFLFSISFLLKKKIVPYLIISIVAISIHSSSIVFLPLYFVYHYIDLRRYSVYKLLTFVLSISVVIFVFFQEGMNISDHFAVYVDDLEDEKGWGNLLRTAYVFVLYMLFCRDKIKKDKYGTLFFWCLLISVAIGIASFGLKGANRIAISYNSFIMLIMPYIYYAIKKQWVAELFLCFNVALFSVYYLLNLPPYEYHYIWDINY